MLGDLDRQMARWMRYVRRLGGLQKVLAVDETELGDSGLPSELKPFALEFDGQKSILERILSSSMNDLTSLRLTSKLVEQSVLVDPATLKATTASNPEAAAASWLDGNSGVFESPFKKGEDDGKDEAEVVEDSSEAKEAVEGIMVRHSAAYGATKLKVTLASQKTVAVESPLSRACGRRRRSSS